MPADVMSASCRTVHNFSRKASYAEIKSGFLVFLGLGGMRQDVKVVVYRTSLEHFAVIYPRKRLAQPTGVVNLKKTAVERADVENGFVVRQKGFDNNVSAKFLCPERDIDPWITAFTCIASPACQHTASLPVLLETEEN